jgi:uridine kinase
MCDEPPTKRQADVLKTCRKRIEACKTASAPLLAGVTGIDAAGKTRFSALLKTELLQANHPVQCVHMDDFHNPCAYRYGGEEDDPSRYYHRSFNINLLVREILEPARTNGFLQADLKLIDLRTDRRDLRRRYVICPATVVLVEGVFLLRPCLARYWDVVITLDVPQATALARAERRDVPAWGPGVMGKFVDKYLPAHERYRGEFAPNCDRIFIDNRDWRRPEVLDVQ